MFRHTALISSSPCFRGRQRRIAAREGVSCGDVRSVSPTPASILPLAEGEEVVAAAMCSGTPLGRTSRAV
jgi:hypothetical protein